VRCAPFAVKEGSRAPITHVETNGISQRQKPKPKQQGCHHLLPSPILIPLPAFVSKVIRSRHAASGSSALVPLDLIDTCCSPCHPVAALVHGAWNMEHSQTAWTDTAYGVRSPPFDTKGRAHYYLPSNRNRDSSLPRSKPPRHYYRLRIKSRRRSACEYRHALSRSCLLSKQKTSHKPSFPFSYSQLFRLLSILRILGPPSLLLILSI